MRRFLALPAIFLALPMTQSGEFQPPGPEERLRAIGSLEGLDESLRRALEPGDDFQPIPAPGPMDWLANHPEEGQTYDGFLKSKAKRPGGARKKIYLLPLGKFPEDRSPPLESLREFTAAFFALEAVALPPLELEKLQLTTRKNSSTGKRQILTGDVLDLLKEKLPADAYCIVAITLEDLYPEPSWNFVFGQAILGGRRGVYSFARFDPAFYGEPKKKDDLKLIHRRSARVLAHEIAHIFGLGHCIYFRCVLNGSNHLGESDSRPLILCPVCLRKLQHSVGFDVVERYRKLLAIYKKAGFEEESGWIDRRWKKIAHGKIAPVGGKSGRP